MTRGGGAGLASTAGAAGSGPGATGGRMKGASASPKERVRWSGRRKLMPEAWRGTSDV